MIIVMEGGKIIDKLVEIKRKQNETNKQKKSDLKNKLESLAQNAARKISQSSPFSLSYPYRKLQYLVVISLSVLFFKYLKYFILSSF